MTTQLMRGSQAAGATGPDAARPGAEAATAAAGRRPSALAEALMTATGGRWAHVRAETRDDPRSVELGPRAGLTTAEHRERVRRQLQVLAQGPHPRRGFPRDGGGADDVGASVTAFEMLGHADLSLLVKAGVQWGLFGGAIANLGSAAHRAELLPQVISLELPGCFAMTETGHGSDVQSLGTTATYDPDGDAFVVHTPSVAARKDYIGGAACDARLAVVFAQLVTAAGGHGVHAVLVPIRDAAGAPVPGVTIEDCGEKAGLGGVDNGRLSFDHVRVPRTALLDRFGSVDGDGTYRSPIDNPSRRFFTMLGTLVRGRISVAGGAGAATRTALAVAVRYAEHRTQFTRPGADDEVTLLDYRAHQLRLLPRLATSYALAFAQNDLVERMHDVQSAQTADELAQRELETRAAGVKAAATWHARDTIQECREACGGAGYLAENVLPALRADTDVFTTFEGDNVVLLQLVAKQLLTGYAHEFGRLDALGTARFVAQQVASGALERAGGQATAAARALGRLGRRGGDAGGDLRSRTTQLALLADREQHVLETVARRLRAATNPDADAFGVFNAAQDHVLLVARAHVDRVVAEAFAAGVEACADPEARRVLDRLCDLHVLSLVDRDRGWYLEHGRLTAARTRQLPKLLAELCTQLRPLARDLVDGFGIPEPWLTAPIAADPTP